MINSSELSASAFKEAEYQLTRDTYRGIFKVGILIDGLGALYMLSEYRGNLFDSQVPIEPNVGQLDDMIPQKGIRLQVEVAHPRSGSCIVGSAGLGTYLIFLMLA